MSMDELVGKYYLLRITTIGSGQQEFRAYTDNHTVVVITFLLL